MEIPFSQEHKNRLDVEVFSRGLSRSRSHATDLIKRGKISVNGKVSIKVSQEISSGDVITLNEKERFVSRAGEKLSFALESFRISPVGLVALDIGSSTGGFTDCLLQNGVQKVISVDVGSDQLVPEIKDNPRVEAHEGTDIRIFSVSEQVDIVAIDVSFISLSHVLSKACECLKKGGSAIALVKPQFEVGMEMAKKFKGVITDESAQKEVLSHVKRYANEAGFKVVAETTSPIEGEKGNKEFLLHLKK